MLKPLQAKNLSLYSNLRHGFFTRQGGCSTGLLSSLNMTLISSEQEKNFQENCRRICDWFDLPLSSFCLMNQVHGNHVCWIEDITSPYVTGDALLTQKPDLILGVRTADCVPVLLYDPKTSIYGAVHVGWRGAHLSLLEKTLTLMEARGSHISNVVAALGPCIQMNSFEVGADIYETFKGLKSHYIQYFKTGKSVGYFQFDLQALVLNQLTSYGVQNNEVLNRDTYQEKDNFFSYRRAQHTRESISGRQLSAISIKEIV